MNWWKELKGRVKFKEPLKNHTTFKIGGKAQFFVEPKDQNDLRRSLILLNRYNIPVFIMGAGSNLLVADSGLNAAVLRLSKPYFKKMTFENNRLNVGAGVNLNQVVSACAKQSLSGAEFLIGIPGTVGGALVMNAGQAKEGRSISELVEEVTVIDYNGRIKKISKKDIKFGYRNSDLNRYIVLSARLKLVKRNQKEIRHKMHKYIVYRQGSQDCAGASAGCIFQNPAGASAGRLIDLCGLKGKRIGGACVSLKHANFIVNKGGAKARDVLKLISIIKKEVKNKFKVSLKPEIKIWQ
jgi:UDP-N-acetylmuramate dehydrogenase